MMSSRQLFWVSFCWEKKNSLLEPKPSEEVQSDKMFETIKAENLESEI